MAQSGFGGALDTPRTNIGDATYLSRAPDFADISQEVSFQSPGKDGNLLQQLRQGRSNGIDIRTPRRRGPLADRRNLPPSVGGAEFTPLLKSATRNSIKRRGKENDATVLNTPALDRIDEDDVTALPRMDTSIYTGSRNQSYLDNTLPQVETSSAASTPLALPPRRGADKDPLNDGNQLSLREQENVIDRIEKENFGLKLKIHFLEEALRRAGPGFSEAALKENTELKVDKVTMQRELHRYKKHLTSAERDLESYRQQMLELQEKARRKYADENQRAEMDKLRQAVEEREADIENLQRQLDQEEKDPGQVEKLQDDISDLQDDLRDKDRLLAERDDELERLKDKLDEAEESAKDTQRKMLGLEEAAHQNDELDHGQVEKLQDDIGDLQDDLRDKDRLLAERDDELENLRDQLDEAEESAKDTQRKMLGLEEAAHQNDELDEAKETIQDLELDVRRVEEELDEMKQNLENAAAQKQRAEADLEELQEEMSNKSVVTKGLSRQIEEKAARLQQELDKSGEEYATLEEDLAKVNQKNGRLCLEIEELRQEQGSDEKIKELEMELLAKADEKDLLQSRHDAITRKSASLQDEVTKLGKEVKDLESSLAEEREHALEIKKDVREQYLGEIEQLNSEISDLQAEIRERDQLYDHDSEKWQAEKQTLESERDRADEGHKRQIDDLELQIHDNEMLRLIESPKPSGSDSGRKAEASELRHQLISARQTIQELKTKCRETERKASSHVQQQLKDLEDQKLVLEEVLEKANQQTDDMTAEASELRHQLISAQQTIQELKTKCREAERKSSSDVQEQLNDLEDQKLVLEEVLDKASQQAEEMTAEHERALRRMKHKLDRAERERNAAIVSNSSNGKHDRHLRKTQAEVENLEHDVRQQQELIDSLVAGEDSLRRKLEAARSERAAYRLSAEKLQRDVKRLRKGQDGLDAAHGGAAGHEAFGTVVRAAEGAQDRHHKEVRGMVMQMEWMQARWVREASLRADAAYAKKFLQLQLDIANAW